MQPPVQTDCREYLTALRRVALEEGIVGIEAELERVSGQGDSAAYGDCCRVMS